MTKNYKIVTQFLRDISSETPNVETYFFVKNNISNYQLVIDDFQFGQCYSQTNDRITDREFFALTTINLSLFLFQTKSCLSL